MRKDVQSGLSIAVFDQNHQRKRNRKETRSQWSANMPHSHFDAVCMFALCLITILSTGLRISFSSSFRFPLKRSFVQEQQTRNHWPEHRVRKRWEIVLLIADRDQDLATWVLSLESCMILIPLMFRLSIDILSSSSQKRKHHIAKIHTRKSGIKSGFQGTQTQLSLILYWLVVYQEEQQQRWLGVPYGNRSERKAVCCCCSFARRIHGSRKRRRKKRIWILREDSAKESFQADGQ